MSTDTMSSRSPVNGEDLDFASLTDVDGRTFDPDLHLTRGDGSPRISKLNKLMKKRGPAANGSGAYAAPGPRPAAKAARGATDYRPGMYGLAQLAAGALMLLSPVDAVAVTTHGPPVIEALQTTSETNPGLASVLDKILTMGPWGLVIAAVLPLGVQIAHNHGLIPADLAVSLGATPVAEIRKSLGLDGDARA